MAEPTTTATAQTESILVTGDDRLADIVGPLAAAAGHPLRRLTRPADAEPRWQRAPLAIVGSDMARACREHGLPPRRDLIVCTTLAWLDAAESGMSMVWTDAIGLHADHVIAVPEATEWLLDRLSRTVRDTTPAPVVAAVAGHGGAGASTFALAAAASAARGGRRVVLIDLDLAGGGVDAAAGLAALPGWRWPSLAGGRGQLEPARLMSGLPRRAGLHLVSPDPRNPVEVAPETLDRVLRAARIGADLVLVDLPRSRTEAAASAAAAAGAVAVALGPSPRSWEAARSVVAAYGVHTARLGTVLRGRVSARPGPVRERGPDLFDDLELPNWGVIPTDPRLPARLRRGRPPKRATAQRLDALLEALTRTGTETGPAEPAARDLAGAAR